MNYLKVIMMSFILFPAIIFCQEIPINDLLYPVKDFGFTLSPSGKKLASIKEFPNGYAILVTDVKAAAIETQIPLGRAYVSNLNWITDNRLSYEQTGILHAINSDGTEDEQLMSMFKDEDRQYYYSAYSLLNNLQTSKMLNVLKDDFEHILIQTRGIDEHPIIYKLDIFTGDKEEIENGNDYDIDEWLVDRNGQVRLGIQRDDGNIKFCTKNEKGEWQSKNDLKLDTNGNTFIQKKLNFLDFDYDGNIIYLASCIDYPRWRILSYDIQKKAYVDTILQDEKYDIGNPVNDNTELYFMDSDERLAGIRYGKDKPYTKWFNETLQAHQDTLKSIYKEYYADIFDWNSDASIILVRLYSDVDPGHIIIYDSSTKKVLIFCSYAKDLIQYPVSYTRTIKYKARDGYEIEGYMNLPIKGDSLFPFIIMPHGGPWARDYWEYDPVVQFFANHGFGVLKMNFRGSTGYGTEHMLSGVKQISTLMIDDIADAVKWAVKQHYADSNNIFLYGHSYGGYAVLESIIRYPDLYRAGVAIAAPTDIIELMDYFDDKDNEFNYEFWKTTVGDPDDEDEYLESISPIYNIAKIKRPIFLFHGENDETIPVAQTQDFIEEAEDLGQKIDYKIIKDEDHSISENRNTEFILRKAIQFYNQNSNFRK